MKNDNYKRQGTNEMLGNADKPLGKLELIKSYFYQKCKKLNHAELISINIVIGIVAFLAMMKMSGSNLCTLLFGIYVCTYLIISIFTQDILPLFLFSFMGIVISIFVSLTKIICN